MSVLPTSWTIRRDPPADGVTNMATDTALLGQVRTGVAVWRWYAWAQPTVSFGRNEVIGGRFSAEQLATAGLAAVRRPTGGRALLHAREITYSVTCPLPASVPWRAAYAAVNRLLVALLRHAGIDAALAGPSPAVPPNGPVCFDQPAEGEIAVAGRKLVGSAVWRQGEAYLQHGSILLYDDQHRLRDGAIVPLDPPPPAATLATLAPGATVALLDDALAAVLAAQGDRIDAPAAPAPLLDRAILADRTAFADPAWLWRR